MSAHDVLVTGATGRQGGAVARRLLEKGHRVRAFTRSPQSPGALQLEGMGAVIVKGDFDDRESLDQALAGATAAFLVATPYESGSIAETRQALAFVDSARSSGTAHLVYSSVASADKRTGIPHFESKHQVERHIESSGITHTILAPVAFVDDFIDEPDSRAELSRGRLAMPLSPTRELQQVSIAEVAELAALAIEQRDRFLGLRIEVASHSIAAQRMAQVLSQATGHDIAYREVPLDDARGQMGDEVADMFAWFERAGFDVDIEKLRNAYPEVQWQTFEEWAGAQDWSRLEPGA
jgi:uncharacterized protein YbjT (DUF2867 family)